MHDAARRAMADRLLRQGFADARVAEALARVPRHLFVPARAREAAYVDEPVPLPEGQTVSAPHMVAIMATALAPEEGDRVLDVGGGSGYAAAVLAELVGPRGRVVSIERRPALAREARRALAAAGAAPRVDVVVGDGTTPLVRAGSFARANVAAAAPEVPPALLAAIAPGGRLVIPVGGPLGQTLLRIDRADPPVVHDLGPVRFVPLVGAGGYRP